MMTSEPGRDPSMPSFNPALAIFLRRQLVGAVDAYRKNGRALAGLSDDALQNRFFEGFADWLSGNTGSDCALNAVSSEFLLRRQPQPLEMIVPKMIILFDGRGPAAALAREPQVVIALGRLIYAPCLGAILAADDDDDGAVHLSFAAIVRAVRGRPERRE